MGSVVLLVMLVVSIMEMMAIAMMMAMVTESHPQAKMFHAHGRTGLPGDLPGPAHHHYIHSNHHHHEEKNTINSYHHDH